MRKFPKFDKNAEVESRKWNRKIREHSVKFQQSNIRSSKERERENRGRTLSKESNWVTREQTWPKEVWRKRLLFFLISVLNSCKTYVHVLLWEK